MIFFGGQAIIFVGLVLWTIWTDASKPRLIPADDIAQVADDIIARHAQSRQAAVEHEPMIDPRSIPLGCYGCRRPTLLGLAKPYSC